MAQRKINILMAAAECAPFAKVGGLADVVGSLPKDLIKKNLEVSVVMPLYKSIDQKKFQIKPWQSKVKVLGLSKIYFVDIYQGKLPGSKVPIYFIKHNKFLTTNQVYPKGKNQIQERFIFFSASVVALIQLLPTTPDLLHLHDWHTGLIPWLLKEQGIYFPTLLTIHNLGSQGKWKIIRAKKFLPKLTGIKTQKQKDINFLLNGITAVDYINTVSPNYAKEILTPEYNEGLGRVLKQRKNKLQGILNGIDYTSWNPSTDKSIKYSFSKTKLAGKTKNKTALQKQLKLTVDPDIPLLGVVSRLYQQKGLDWVTKIIPKLVKHNMQLVVLGTGDPKLEQALLKWNKKYPKQIAAILKYDGQMARQIYAATDMFLIPSRFEPCGLTQMIAMRYGSVPIVRATGGLKDTVKSYRITKNKVIGNGFVFSKKEAPKLYQTIVKALKVYDNKPNWKSLRNNCLNQDFSWQQSANDYLNLYKKIIK